MRLGRFEIPNQGSFLGKGNCLLGCDWTDQNCPNKINLQQSSAPK
ncbi:MAG: hypothetical protein ACI9FU_001607 [Granulosicoccus sp.]|jgi:hypothetical protein